MHRMIKSFNSLSIASIKMYFRNISAVFFTLFIPVFLISIFGVIDLGKESTISISATNYSSSQFSTDFLTNIGKVTVFKIEQISESVAADKLAKGKTDLQLIIPKNFGQLNPTTHQPDSVAIQAYYNKGKPQVGQTAGLILDQAVNKINDSITKTPHIISLQTTGVSTNNLNYIDFLIPGIIAISIMQLGIFNVAFTFVSLKNTGALRRIQATPTHPVVFLVSQSISRLIIAIAQVVILITLGIVLFHLHFIGSILTFLLFATLGSLIFLAFGFAVAGWAKDENQVAPVANLVSFPQMFLSGTFFPRDSFPAWLEIFSKYLPLTYLTDGLRRIANEGANLWTIRGDFLGLLIWGIIALVVAVKVFSWE